LGTWRFTPATIEIRHWSYGRIRTIADLYDPKIFGPTGDLRCECGKHAGREAAGALCDVCGVKVAEDSALLRRTRLGHVEISCWGCRHPLAPDQPIYGFPIAPIAYRRDVDGSVNALGRKYEALVQACMSADAALLPIEPTEQYVAKISKFDNAAVVSAIAEIVGVQGQRGREPMASPGSDSLLGLVMQALTTNDPEISALVRSCGLALEVNDTM